MCSLVYVVSTGIQWAAHKRWIGSFSRSREGGGGPLGSVGLSVAGGLRASRHVSVYVNLMSQVRRLRTRVGAACVFLGIG